MRTFRFKRGLKLLMASALFLSTVACVESASREAVPDSSKAVSDVPQDSTTPAPPKTSIDTTYRRPAGKTINVGGTGASAARAFQAALDSARPGDTIAIEPGSIVEGNFKLPAKKGDGWTVIRSSASDEKLPPEGKRVTPAMAGAMPKLVCPNPDPLISTAAGAHHYRFIGIEFSLADGVAQNYGLIVLGDGTQKSLDALPHDLIVDRCYIHGNSSANLRRGIAMNSASTAIVDSYISDIHEVGADSQAICCWNGPGPFKIVNNYLEAAGENVMFGGADPSIADLVPSDIEFRHNHCFKPLTWMPSRPGYAGKHWTVKNIFELKNARRVHIEQNLFENNWLDGQSGFAILFTVRNQDGASPWSSVEDVTFINNVLRHSAAGIMFIGRDNNHPSQQVKRVLIANNLFADIGGTQWGNNGRWIQLTETDAVTIDHNTALQTGNLITAHGVPNQRFVYTNNISVQNEYGIIGDGTAPGAATLSKYFPAAIFKKNVIAGGRSNIYPGENFFPANIDEARFANRAKDDYSLSAGSPYLNAGSDRKTLGCDMNVLKSVIDSAGAGRGTGESQ